MAQETSSGQFHFETQHTLETDLPLRGLGLPETVTLNSFIRAQWVPTRSTL